jgi:RND family efflux transporter MFP subunit
MSRKRILWSAVVVCVVLAIVAVVVHRRGGKPAPDGPRAAAVVDVTRGTLASSLTVAGQFQAYQDVDLHAKVTGYIRHIGVDIGDLVRKGEVLAVLEVPELTDQITGAEAEVRHSQSEIDRAQSEVVRAQSDYSALHADYTRLAEVSRQKPGLVAEQELDDARAKDQAAQAQIGVAKSALEAMQEQLGVSKADDQRLHTLHNYTQIIAPFDGVVTMRYADTGALINAGTSSDKQSMPVVRVAQSDLLRLRMPVPEADVPYIKLGGIVGVRVSATGRTFNGRIIRFTRSLDTGTRTMLVEVDVLNADLSLNPGMYAETTVRLQQKNDTLILPAQAIIHAEQNDSVFVLDATNHIVSRPVTLGIQTANRVEILSGVKAGDRVIASGQANYQPGEVVSPQPAYIPTTAQEEGE